MFGATSPRNGLRATSWIRVSSILALGIAAVFSPALLGGRVIAPEDGTDFFVPAFLADHASWDPWVMTGHPAFADPQRMTWYLPARVPGGLATWNLFLLSALALGGAGMARFVARRTGSELGAFGGAACFALGGFMIAHLRHANLVHAVAWLPWALDGADRLAREPTGRRLAGTAAAIAMMLLAGHPQMAAYGLLTIGAIVAAGSSWKEPRTALAGLGAFCAAALLACGIAAILLVPVTELAKQSVRADLTDEEFFVYSLKPSDLPRFVVPAALRGGADSPEAKGALAAIETSGALGLAALALSLFALAVRAPGACVFAGVAAVSILLALGQTTPVGVLPRHLPILDLFRVPGRHLVELHLAGSVLVGLGLASLRARFGPRISSALAAVLVVELALHASFFEWRFGSPGPEAFDIPPEVRGIRDDLGPAGQRIFPVLGIRGSAPLAPPNRSAIWSVASASGYNPLRLSRTADLLGIDLRGQVPPDRIVGAHRGLDLAAVRFLTMPPSMHEQALALAGSDRWEHAFSNDRLVVLENVSAMSRAWLASDAVRLTPDEALRTIATSQLPNGEPFDPARTALVEEEIAFVNAASDSDRAGAAADSVHLDFDRGRISRAQVHTAEPGLLVLSDAYHSGWRARIDGAPAPVVRCDYAFMAVEIPAGTHVVVFDFRPQSFVVGASISAAALLLGAGLALTRVRRRTETPPSRSPNRPRR